MNVYIDGLEVSPNNVTYNNGEDFGRFNTSGIIVHHYKMVIHKNELLASLRHEFWALLEEAREDENMFHGGSPFKKSGYKPLHEMFGFPKELALTIKIWFDRYLFEKLLPKQDGYSYMINSTDSISVDGEEVIINGRSF